MSILARKNKARALLLERDRAGLLAWSETVRNPLRTLFSLSYDPDELLRWRAVEAIGIVSGQLAESNLDQVRDFLRRLIWLMSDESGGLSWRSPELIGEILVNVPRLVGEYGPLLLSYLREEPFEAGSHQAVYRLARRHRETFKDDLPNLVDSLADPSPAVRGWAALAVGAISLEAGRDMITGMTSDPATVDIYDFDSGRVVHTTVGKMARRALGKEDSSEQAA